MFRGSLTFSWKTGRKLNVHRFYKRSCKVLCPEGFLYQRTKKVFVKSRDYNTTTSRQRVEN